MDATTAQVYSTKRPERRGVSRRRVIEAAKEAVPVIDLADRLCGPGQMRRVGERWVARCPLPDHDDKSPSFVVYVETNSWFCFGACQRGGDVVDLAAAAWGYGEDELAMAAADLLREFGHETPARPASWHRKQERQRAARNALYEAKIRHLQRRVYRIFMPLVEKIESEVERREEARMLWEVAGEIAALIWAGRRAA